MTVEPLHTNTDAVLLAALEFRAAGVSVVPVRNDGTKAPAGPWKDYQERLASPEQVVAWCSGADGFGIITGHISGNLEMLELEGRAVEAGIHNDARDLAEASGLDDVWQQLADTYIEQTPSGGIHWLYRIADHPVPGNTKIARRPGENGGVDVLVETRGEGGFVVVAPSGRDVHPSGQPWVRIGDSTPARIATITWEQRNQIHDVLRAFDSMPTVDTITAAVTPQPRDTTKPGDDYNARATWDDILTPLGWAKVYRRGNETYWRRPGKSVGISASTGRNDGDNLYVWTTSTTFAADRPYSKFAAYAHLHHGNDYSAAASALRQQGYGSPSLVQSATLNPFDLPADSGHHGDHDDSSSNGLVDDFTESTWQPVDLGPHLTGTYIAPIPSVLRRKDGVGLLYPGRVHSFYGESESGKSWLAQHAVAEALNERHQAVYIDFESDATDVIARLRLMGVPDQNIASHLTYIRPETRPNEHDPNWQELLERTEATLVIIDGVTEALTMWGGETVDNDSITLWTRRFPRRLAQATGAAVVTIDHIPKNADTRGRFAIGGQAKLAALDGAAYLIEPIDAMAPGKVGRLTIRVTKDRPGGVRKTAGDWRKSDRTQEAAVVILDATTPDTLTVELQVPATDEQQAAHEADQLRRALERILRPAGPDGLTINRLTSALREHGIRVRNGHLPTMLEDLVDDGFLYVDKVGQARHYRIASLLDQLAAGDR